MGGLRGQSQMSSVSNKPLKSCPDESIPPYFEKLLPYNENAQDQEAETCPSGKLRALTPPTPVASAVHRPNHSGLRTGRSPRSVSIPGPPVSQAEVVLEGRALRNAHLRAGVGTVQDAAVGPAAPLPFRSAVVLKKHGAAELVEDDGVHGVGWQKHPVQPQRLGAGPPGAPQGSGSRR